MTSTAEGKEAIQKILKTYADLLTWQNIKEHRHKMTKATY